MTVRNSDTGESFEVSVPDGLKIYQYNSNWLDSIPYLLERARYGEPWAYEALGDCYRYGKGGVKRSFFNAIIYYNLAGRNIDEMAIKVIEENPGDPLGLLYKLVDRIEAGDNDGILCVIDTLDQADYHDADILKTFLEKAPSDSTYPSVENKLLSPEVGTDEMLFTLIANKDLWDWALGSFENPEDILKFASAKFPYLSNVIGMNLLSDIPKDLNPEDLKNLLTKGISFLEEADKAATLSREGAEILYNHYKSEIDAGRMSTDNAEMERLAILAGLPESETFIFQDKQQD
ncbi:MAG: SEL1-like repeat protein [Muribaculaceae bacterium]|nr:SEL1-like repeat protein [Muribaculaceae bacterium]